MRPSSPLERTDAFVVREQHFANLLRRSFAVRFFGWHPTGEPPMQPLPSGTPSRRQLFGLVGTSALTLAFDTRPSFSQEKQPGAALSPLNRFPRTVQEWYVEQVRAAVKIGNERRAKLKTKAD